MRIGIIGAGASGILCALLIKKKYGENVIVDLYEKEDKIGKKILQTGNGKCNFTNAALSEKYFNNPLFLKNIFKEYNVEKILDTFSSLGIIYKVDDEGRYYPYSESAASFLEVLKSNLSELGVNVYTDTKVVSIETKKGVYLLNENQYYDKVIIAIGGKARVKEYDDSLLKNLGLKMTFDKPGLVSIKVKEKFLKPISGVRLKVKAKVINDNKIDYENEGELLFKDDSLSGIIMFSCSRFVNENSIIELDLVKDYQEEFLLDYLNGLKPTMPVKQFLISLFPPLLANTLSKVLGVIDKKIKELSFNEKREIIKKLKSFRFNVESLNDYSNAQIMCGGIDIGEVDERLELKKHPSIYVLGEVLDIDGECGGFNLSFAWASALLVADHIFD